MKRGYARGEARNEAVRAELEPLAPGERPRAVTVAAIVAALLAAGNLVAAAFADPTAAQWRLAAVQAAVLLVAAIGMWRTRYWAVLGFQALLGIGILIAFLQLLRAANLAAVLYTVAIIGLSGTMFWFLVRAMARIQMPDRGPAQQP